MKIRNPTNVMYLTGSSHSQMRLRGICIFITLLLFSFFSLPLFPAQAFAFFNGHTALCENAVSLMRVDTFSPDGLMCLVVSPAGTGDGNDVVVSPAGSWGSGDDDACATPGDYAATSGDFIPCAGGSSGGRDRDASPAATPGNYI